MGLKLTWWVTPARFTLVFPETWPGVLLFSLYSLLSLWLLYRRRTDFRIYRPTEMLLVTLGLLVTGFASGLLVVSADLAGFFEITPFSQLTNPPAVSLIALGILSAIAIWLGPGPGLIGWVFLGVAQSGFSSLSANDIFAFALWGYCTGLAVHQGYSGRYFGTIRTPLIAMSTGALTLLVSLSLNRFAEAAPPFGPNALEGMLSAFNTGWLLWLLCGLGIGALFTLLQLIAPELRPQIRADTIPVTQKSLRARVLVVLIPLIMASVIVSVVTVTDRAMQLAVQQAMGELDRTAAIASGGIELFDVSGRNLLEKFSAERQLTAPESIQSTLETQRRLVPFFQEMLLTDAQGNVIAIAPADAVDLELSAEETALIQQALQFSMSGSSHLLKLPSGAVRMTFSHPLITEMGDQIQGVLLGRVQLEVNPEMARVLKTLQSSYGAGQGFLVDDRNLIVLHSEPGALLSSWRIDADALSWLVGAGQAYRDFSAPNRESTLFYTRPVNGTPFTIVIELPYAVIFDLSRSISRPLLSAQIPIAVLLLLIIPLLIAQFTRPLHTLTTATDQIAEGNLDVPVQLSGHDEVAQLGAGFEQMRLRLKDQLNDLALLLKISQSVSGAVTLDDGVPLILDGILEATGAAVAHFILLDDEHQRVYGAGLQHPAFQGMDRALSSAVARRQEPIVEQGLSAYPPADMSPSPLRSIAAFPVRYQNRAVAVLWVGALKAQAFNEIQVRFLNTLASQSAALVENIRLFESTEDGRQRLAAIVSSTTDAIMVIDQERRLLLINPAAEKLLRLNESAYGYPLNTLKLPMPIIEAVNHLGEATGFAPSSVEFTLPDKRTFNANIAPIKGLATKEGAADSRPQIYGWVAVMRDVTHFKELDEMKTDFVSTVSHDLRAPLTFMSGYVTMLNMAGELNEKQQEYQKRILEGIEQMSALIDDLLNLRRIEAGLGIRQEPCRLGLILLEAVDSMRGRATAKGVTLRLEPARTVVGETSEKRNHSLANSDGGVVAGNLAPLPGAQPTSATIIGDRTLLRQAIGNLVDNAIKYTPAGGFINVGMDLSDDVAVVHVSDTGIGITPENQLRLFEKFYRVKGRETSDIAGTGLGLALVKSIVERHQGRVWIESELNQGSTFYIALPLQSSVTSKGQSI